MNIIFFRKQFSSYKISRGQCPFKFFLEVSGPPPFQLIFMAAVNYYNFLRKERKTIITVMSKVGSWARYLAGSRFHR